MLKTPNAQRAVKASGGVGSSKSEQVTSYVGSRPSLCDTCLRQAAGTPRCNAGTAQRTIHEFLLKTFYGQISETEKILYLCQKLSRTFL